MKILKFIFIGILFGIIMTKSEAISWFRIQEMFRFQSIHMYGIIGTALICGVLIIQAIKKLKFKNLNGDQIQINDKKFSVIRYLGGGILFGFGWALTGACPGPLFTLLGNGYSIFIVVLLSAVMGTFCYGLVREKLPH